MIIYLNLKNINRKKIIKTKDQAAKIYHKLIENNVFLTIKPSCYFLMSGQTIKIFKYNRNLIIKLFGERIKLLFFYNFEKMKPTAIYRLLHHI